MSEKKGSISSSSDNGSTSDKANQELKLDKFDPAEEKISCSETWNRYPKHVFFIVGNEFCERFSYYGMRSVLLLYFRNYLHWDDDTSTAIYHAFTVLVYLFPLFGAILADSYLGKYKTILYLSIVYVFGHLVKTIGSIPYVPSQTAHVVLSMAGLLFIAIGSGGIKPCVSAFGGDQFPPEEVVIRKQFFSIFYFAINAGSLISTFVTPIFRADVDCYPNETEPQFDECYALAFGVPGALMVVATILFVLGSSYYIMYPPEGSIFAKVCKCIYHGCKNKWNTPKNERTKEHWLDYSESEPKLIRDTKYVLNVLVLYIPLPFFWALFDQQGSRWTLQAIQTNGYLGSILIKPDQVEVLNPLLIVTLIPLFEVTLYPALRYFKIEFPPLRRMTVGLILAGVSFIAAAILQIEIDKTLTPLPLSTQYGVRFINADNCVLQFENNIYPNVTVKPYQASDVTFFSGAPPTFTYQDCNSNQVNIDVENMANEDVLDYVTYGYGNYAHFEMVTHKTEDGGGRFTFINVDTSERALVLKFVVAEGDPPERPAYVNYLQRSIEIDVAKGLTKVLIYENSTFTNTEDDIPIDSKDITLDVGAVYSMVFKSVNDIFIVQDLNGNTINVAWMIPQFVLITVGEVFLSITGLEFSYSQAPPTMKSVLQSIWLLTVSLGNIIVLIIAEAQGFEKQSDEFFLFAGLIFVAALLFIVLAYRYVPVDENAFREEILAEQEKRLKMAEDYNKNKGHTFDVDLNDEKTDFSAYENEASVTKF